MMKDKKKLPSGLAEKQELQRQETINKVWRACADIKAEGGKVTITALMEYTGLARSTFAKPHIRGLLMEYGYAQNAGRDAKAIGKKPNIKATDKDKLIAELKACNAELKACNAELERECELLRGRLFLMMNN